MAASYTRNNKPLEIRWYMIMGIVKTLCFSIIIYLKIISYMMLKNLMLKNFIPSQFSLKILNLTHKNTFKISSAVCNQCRAIFTVFLALLQLIRYSSNITQGVVFKYKNFLSLVKQRQNYLLFVTLRMKQTLIFLKIVPKLICFGLALKSFSMAT